MDDENPEKSKTYSDPAAMDRLVELVKLGLIPGLETEEQYQQRVAEEAKLREMPAASPLKQ